MSQEHWKSAEQLMSELSSDPNHLARRHDREKEFQQLADKYVELTRPVLERLSSEGFIADSIEHLVRRYAPLPTVAASILLEFLDPHQDARLCESIVRALAAACEPFDGRPLAACFDATTDESLRWCIANTIALARPHSIRDWVDGAKDNSTLKMLLMELCYDS